MLVGAWARGDAHPESPIELLVVLDRILDRWQEKRRMDRIVWRHSMRHDTVVTVLPVTESELEQSATPMFARATAEGILVK
jgi:predicted nucleotidyltransferase